MAKSFWANVAEAGALMTPRTQLHGLVFGRRTLMNLWLAQARDCRFTATLPMGHWASDAS